MGINSTENLQNIPKSQCVHLHFIFKLYTKYQDPSSSGSSDILFTRLSLYKRHMSEKGEKLNHKFVKYAQKFIS